MGKINENSPQMNFLVTPAFKSRVKHQSDRLGISYATLCKMALTKFIEEEEQIEQNNAFRRVR